MKILIVDNYDSFTYNLYHLVKQVNDSPIDVLRNDKIKLEDIKKYDKIILSPGPGIPNEAGLLLDIIKHYYSSKHILGVCLGMQAIGESFGGKLKNLDKVFHGVSTLIDIVKPSIIFKDCPQSFDVGRYHSWVVDNNNLPNDLEITALDKENNMMALQHKNLPVFGVQFHPESILTPLGKNIINNFINNL